jgi:hypothetical protein
MPPETAGNYQHNDADVDRITELFLERFGTAEAVLERTAAWFDRELQPAFGIDILEEPFEPTRGYAIRRTSDVELLTLTTESLDHAAPHAFADFLGIEDFRIVKNNLGSDQKYGPAYKRFKQLIALPPAFIDLIYSSPFVCHFYDEAQISSFRRQWGERMG